MIERSPVCARQRFLKQEEGTRQGEERGGKE